MAIDPTALGGTMGGVTQGANPVAPMAGAMPQPTQEGMPILQPDPSGGIPMHPDEIPMAEVTPMAAPGIPGAPMMMPQPQPKKAPSVVPPELGRRIADAYNKKKHEIASIMAADYGEARGMIGADERAQLVAWRATPYNPIDLPRLMATMKSHGMGNDDIVDTIYPLRRSLVTIGHRTWEEKVAFSDRMNALDKDPKYAALDAREFLDKSSNFPSESVASNEGESLSVDDDEV